GHRHRAAGGSLGASCGGSGAWISPGLYGGPTRAGPPGFGYDSSGRHHRGSAMATEAQGAGSFAGAPKYFVYPFFLVHMLMFGVAGFVLAYGAEGDVGFRSEERRVGKEG